MTSTGPNHSTPTPPVLAALETIPAKRLGAGEDIAGPCIMLASKAGSYMNNACLVSRRLRRGAGVGSVKGRRGEMTWAGQALWAGIASRRMEECPRTDKLS